MVSADELDAVELLPAGTNLIHVGPIKTGSTAIQSAFANLRPVLDEYGVHVPATSSKPRPYIEPLGFHGMRGAPPRDDEEWDALLAGLADAADKRVLISHEQLCRATDDQMRQVVHHLGGARPHVLMAARRYDTYVPSHWQQVVKARITLTYEQFLRQVTGPDSDDPLARHTWSPHDTVDQVKRWADVVGLDAVTVVVSNDRDHGFLPGVFERLLGLPAGSVADNITRSNRSLTYPEVELLRQFALSLKEREATLEEFHRLMRQGVLRAMQRQPATSEQRVPPLPRWAMDPVRERTERRLAGLGVLRSEGLRVIGDLDRLRIPDDAPVSDDVLPPVAMSVETAARAAAALAKIELRGHRKAQKQVDRLEEQLRRSQARVDELEERLAANDRLGAARIPRWGRRRSS